MTGADVETWIGGVPWREVPHPEPAILARVLAREEVACAWVGDLPSTFAADPHAALDAFFDALAPHAGVLLPAPTIEPACAGWERALERAIERSAVAIRCHPTQRGFAADAASLRALAGSCARASMPIVLAASLEVGAGEAFRGEGADSIAAVLRAAPGLRVVVTGAGRALIERVHATLSEEERARLRWSISAIAGPPADDLAALLRALGGERFLYGSGWPLRLTQVPRANLALLPPELAATALAEARAVARALPHA